jgi:acyl-CoA synthetase (AMP-forming)/AMP-acid ligase II
MDTASPKLTEVATLLARQRALRPGATAAVDADGALNYAQLDELCGRVAGNLRRLGIRRGDTVALLLPDGIPHLALVYALARLGAVIAPVHPAVTTAEMQRITRGLELRAWIRGSGVSLAHRRTGIPLVELFKPVPEVAGEGENSDGRMEESGPGGEASPLLLGQSSGTTGEPKRFLLTHAQAIARAREHGHCLGVSGSDVFLQAPPLSFLTGILRAFMIADYGASLVLVGAPSAEALGGIIDEHRVTFTFMVPLRIRALLDRCEGSAVRFPGLKLFTGSAPMNRADKLRCKELLTPRLLEGYGVNEIGLVAVEPITGENPYPDSVGRLIEGIEVQVVDENDRELNPGELGQIRIRKPPPFLPNRYLGDVELTGRCFRDGWFYPGDIVAVNEEGYVFIKGRVDDVINRNGVKFYPAEIEAVLCEHSDVSEVAVVSEVSESGRVLVTAFLVAEPGCKLDLAAVLNYGRRRLGFKAPDGVKLIDEIPRSPAGKPLKRELE